MGQNIHSRWHDVVMQVFFHTYYFVLPLFIIEGPPQSGMTPENVTIVDHTSVNYRVMDI